MDVARIKNVDLALLSLNYCLNSLTNSPKNIV